jgi:hypothetical protein
MLVDRLVGDGPETCAEINGDESLPRDGPGPAEVAPAHEDADFEHDTLCGAVSASKIHIGTNTH